MIKNGIKNEKFIFFEIAFKFSKFSNFCKKIKTITKNKITKFSKLNEVKKLL